MQKTGYRDLLLIGLFITPLTLISSFQISNNQIKPSDKSLPDGEWKIIGPGAGGGVFIPSVSPFDNSLVFAKGDMTGDFVTYDGGISWKLFNLMSVVQDYEFDPVDANANLRQDTHDGSLPLFLSKGVCEKSADVVYMSVYIPDSGPDQIKNVRYGVIVQFLILIFRVCSSLLPMVLVYITDLQVVLNRNLEKLKIYLIPGGNLT